MADQTGDVDPRDLAAPELFRGRASNTAGLVASATAAVAAGVLFGASAQLGPVGQAAAVVGVIGLLTSLALYVAASQHSRTHEVKKGEEEAAVRRLAVEIRLRMRLAAFAALAAGVSLGVVVLVAAIESRFTADVQLVLTEEGLDALAPVCAVVPENPLPATVRRRSLDTDGPHLRVSSHRGACGAERVDVTVLRTHVVAIRD